MRHRIFVERIEPETVISGDEFHHSVRVVRLREGEEVEVFDRSGNMARGTAISIGKDQAVITIGDPIPSRESPVAMHLAMALIQPEKFELVLQKGTELGVTSFIPLVTERVEIRPERVAGKAERWERIVFEAVKQCGRSHVPVIETPARLSDVLQRDGVKIFFDADAESPRVERAGAMTLCIGPEGGWSDEERTQAKQSGAWFQRLGPRRLRAETAAIAALAVTGSRFGDL
jgi:16S rRNA (uracil1498-N3)-methyltransferase